MMRTRSTVAVLPLLALCATGVALAQDKTAPKPEMATMAPSTEGAAEMEAMMKAGTPGEPHKKLSRMVGDWTYTSKAWMDPSQPPVESKGTMRSQTILGGRYVEQVWKGDFMGMAFEGRGTEGYDNVTKKYFSTWMDNMSTGLLVSNGNCDEKGDKCAYSGEMTDPMTGKTATMRNVITWTGADTFKNEMYGPGQDGKEYKMMEITAKKK